MGRVDGRVALVTGAASGLGEATARLLAREGAAVIVADIDAEGGARVAGAIAAEGGTASFCRLDVAIEGDWSAAIADAVRRHGRLDILINNAGYAEPRNIEEVSLEAWRRSMAVNLDGVFLGTKHAILTMKATGGGSIVNISSIEGIVGDPNLPAYNAAKGGVRLLTKSAALHCAKKGYGIRVNSVHPGYMSTPAVERWLASTDKGDRLRASLEAMHPLGHLGQPDDVAQGVLYLASAESKFVTGAELVIDGGYTAR